MSNFVLTPNAVAKLRRAIAPRSGNTGAIAATGVPIDPDKFPPPFTVRWSASAASGAGAWVIWLPDKAQLVMLKDAYITPTGVTAEQALPGGWYTIDDAAASSTEVYLNITIPETGTPSAEISTAQGQSTTGETVMSILVAEMETDAQTRVKRVKQYVDSAALVGSVKDGESGADAGIYITQEPIAPSTDHPGGGIQITFQPLQDGQPHGQPTVVTLWNGSGGGGGGTDLSDTPALDVVPSTGQASAGVAATASRQDHVHKMPATVVLTDVDQTIDSFKTFTRRIAVDESSNPTQAGASSQYGRMLLIQDLQSGNARISLYGKATNPDVKFSDADLHGQLDLDAVNQYLRLVAFSGYSLVLVAAANKSMLAAEPTVAPVSIDATTRKSIASLGWVGNNCVTMGTTQQITGSKRFTESVIVGTESATHVGLGYIELFRTGDTDSRKMPYIDFHYDNSSSDYTSRIIESAQGVIVIMSPNHAQLSVAPITDPSASGYKALQIDTVGAANDRFQRKLSGTVEFIPGEGIRWNTDTHTLQKRVDTLNLATGEVTQGSWSDITNGGTTPISSIIPQSS